MAKKKSALFMTVGLGGEDQKKIDSLAHGMLETILDGNFDYVVLFGSEKSKPTVESLKRQYVEKFNENTDDEILDEFDYYEFVQNDNVNDFNSYYNVIRSKILELQDEYSIKINYTPGTKTMSISAAIASLIFRKKLRLIDGDRGKGTTVRSGTEKHVDFSLYVVYDEVLLRRIKEYFNSNHLSSGKLLIKELTGDEYDTESYLNLFDAYLNWDNINFSQAFNHLNNNLSSKFPDLKNQLNLNLKALNIINRQIPIRENGETVGYRDHNLKRYYELASIINNAERRFEEKKYDDAIARLYRSLELIAQIKLEDYDIMTNNVDVSLLKDRGVCEEFINDLKMKQNGKNVIKSGLVLDYLILNELNDDLGKTFKEKDSKIMGQLESRNNSIFAHGLESKTENEYLSLKKTVLEFSKILYEKIDDCLLETKFPKFDI